MTFATRDRYRHVVERIAKRTGRREASVAQWAVDLARQHGSADPRRSHVGFYLIDEGLSHYTLNGERVPIIMTVTVTFTLR